MTSAAVHHLAPTAPLRPVELICAGYFGVQVIGGAALWTATAAIPAVRSGMELLRDQPQVTDAFFLPDVAVTIVGSLLTAIGILRRARWRVPAAAFTFGCVLYPTVLLAGWVPQHGTGTGALGVMLPTALLCGWCAVQVWRDSTGQPVAGQPVAGQPVAGQPVAGQPVGGQR